MGRLLRKLAGISAIAAAVAMTWSAPAEAIPTFSITPDPASAAPGGSVDFVLTVTDAADFADWLGFIVTFGSPTGYQDPPLAGAPAYPYVELDTGGGLEAGVLVDSSDPSFILGIIPGDQTAFCSGIVGCVEVFNFAGLSSASGELLKFRLKVGPETPPGDILVQYSVNYTGEPLATQEFTITSVPEPSSYYLFAAGILMLALSRLPRFQRAVARVS